MESSSYLISIDEPEWSNYDNGIETYQVMPSSSGVTPQHEIQIHPSSNEIELDLLLNLIEKDEAWKNLQTLNEHHSKDHVLELKDVLKDEHNDTKHGHSKKEIVSKFLLILSSFKPKNHHFDHFW